MHMFAQGYLAVNRAKPDPHLYEVDLTVWPAPGRLGPVEMVVDLGWESYRNDLPQMMAAGDFHVVGNFQAFGRNQRGVLAPVGAFTPPLQVTIQEPPRPPPQGQKCWAIHFWLGPPGNKSWVPLEAPACSGQVNPNLKGLGMVIGPTFVRTKGYLTLYVEAWPVHDLAISWDG